MDEHVTAADANRSFSRILRGVQDGNSYVVTSHGRPVARIVPIDHEQKGVARAALLAKLQTQRTLNAGCPRRDEAYDD